MLTKRLNFWTDLVRRVLRPSGPAVAGTPRSFQRRLMVEELEARDLMAALPISLTVPQDVIATGGTVFVSMYAQLLDSYTPPGGTQINALDWVYFNGTDYQATPISGNLTSFLTVSSAITNQTFTLPDVDVQAAHVVFGVGTAPFLPTAADGSVAQPTPAAAGSSIYDFVEFTLQESTGLPTNYDVLTINTSMIDQFGFPILLNISPSQETAPDGVGVTLSRSEALTGYKAFLTNLGPAGDPFETTQQDGFGSAITDRIVSPKDLPTTNQVSGIVTPTTSTTTGGTLDMSGTYYYAVTAVGANGVETLSGNSFLKVTPNTISGYLPANNTVQVAWSPFAGAASYNVYRGTTSGSTVTWVKISGVTVPTYYDDGTITTAGTPPADPLSTYFDGQIQQLFTTYATAGRSLDLITTDGTGNGYVYYLSGTTTTSPPNAPTGNQALEFNVSEVKDAAGNNVTPTDIPVGTKFYVYYPYFNTNTYNAINPAPPTWMPFNNVSASSMVFSGEGVFADNKVQPAPAGTTGSTWQIVLGSIENQVVSALTRGIANSTTIAPFNWANNPIQVAPSLSAGGSLLPNTTYYYVITSVNAAGESTQSTEFSQKTTATDLTVNVNWKAFNLDTAASFNIYRSLTPGGTVQLAGSATNGTPPVTTFLDDGTGTTPATVSTFYPAGVPSNLYAAYWHQPSVSKYGLAYGSSYDDQGNWSSTLSNPSGSPSASITLGPWTTITPPAPGPTPPGPGPGASPAPVNAPPSVGISAPPKLRVDTPMTFTGTATDPEGGAIVSTSWAVTNIFGITIATGTGTSFTTRFPQAGYYNITFSATDSEGASASTTATLFATNVDVATRGKDEYFVADMYQVILGRQVDPIGLRYWTGLMDKGMSRDQVAQGIANSREARVDEINSLYQEILGRPADAGGMNGFLAMFASGATTEQVKAVFYGSAEYQLQHPDNSDFLNQIFLNELGQEIDPFSLSVYLGQLNSGASRQSVAYTIVSSQQARQLIVNGFYNDYLNRAPDPSGFNNWMGTFNSSGGRENVVLGGILGSKEYFRSL